jgi:hypothetical protein
MANGWPADPKYLEKLYTIHDPAGQRYGFWVEKLA